jgi:hypothetical protein
MAENVNTDLPVTHEPSSSFAKEIELEPGGSGIMHCVLPRAWSQA